MNDVEIDSDMEDTDDSRAGAGTGGVPGMAKPMAPLLSVSSQLLPQPTPAMQDFSKFAPKPMESQNFLTASQFIGVNTQGSSLKNANYDLRANPIIPKVDVSPWSMSTIEPNTYAKQLFG